MEKIEDMDTGGENNIGDGFSSTNHEADDVVQPSTGEQYTYTSIQDRRASKEDTLPSSTPMDCETSPAPSTSNQENNMPMLFNEENEDSTRNSHSEDNAVSTEHVSKEDQSVEFGTEDKKEDSVQLSTSALDEGTFAWSDTGDTRTVVDSEIPAETASSVSSTKNDDVSVSESTALDTVAESSQIPDPPGTQETKAFDTSFASEQSPVLQTASTYDADITSPEAAVDDNVTSSTSQTPSQDNNTVLTESSALVMETNEPSSECNISDTKKNESNTIKTSTPSFTTVEEEIPATPTKHDTESDTCEEPLRKKQYIIIAEGEDISLSEHAQTSEPSVLSTQSNTNSQQNDKQEDIALSTTMDVSTPISKPTINGKISGSSIDEQRPITRRVYGANVPLNEPKTKSSSNTQPAMGEGIAEDVEVTKQPVIIKEAQKEVGKLDLLVCGQCHEVFFFAEQFNEHKSLNKCQTSGSEVTKTSEGENKSQIWAYNLWKQKQQRVKNDSDTTVQSPWLYYQRWCKLSSAEREPWIKAGESLLWQNIIMTAKLKELREIKPASPVKDPLALDDIADRETEIKKDSPAKLADQKPVIVKKEDSQDTKQLSGDKSAVRTTTEPTQEQFVVERILAKRFTSKRKTWEYKIKWENFPEEESTWEPLAHLKTCKTLVDEFEEKLRKMKVEKLKQAVASPVRGRGRPRLTTSPSPSMRSNTSVDRLVGSRPQRSSKQKALHQVKAWCGNMSDGEGGTSGVKRPYEDDSSDDSFGKKLKLGGGETDDSEDEIERKFSPPKKTAPKATIVNNGIGTKLPDNILIPDAKGVVRINQKQLPSLSSGVYIMSKTAGIIKLDSATSKMATSAGQAMIKVAPKIGQTHIKIVKKDGGTASKVIPMHKANLSKIPPLVRQTVKVSPKLSAATMGKLKKPILHEKVKLSASNVIEKAMADITGESKPDEKAQQSDSDYGLEELEFPADLPLPDPESPPGEFVLDPITGKIAGREYPEPQPEPEIVPAPKETLLTEGEIKTDMETSTIADNSLDNLVKLAAADITEDDLQPLPSEAGVMETSGGESGVETTAHTATSAVQPKSEVEMVVTSEAKSTPETKTIITVTSKEIRAGSNQLQQTLQTSTPVPQPRIQQRVLNQSVGARPGSFTTVVRSVATPRKVIAAPKPKFQISSQARPIGESPRMQYGKPGIPRKIGSTTIYKSVTNIRKEPMKQPVKRVSAVYHSTPSSYKGSPVVTYKSASPGTYRQSPMMKTAHQTVYRTPPKKEPVVIRSTISPKKPKPVISMPSLTADEEMGMEVVQQVPAVPTTVTEEPSVAAPAMAETDLSSFTLANNEPPIFLTGDDGTVYQVAGQDEQGQTILITQGADGQQQCLLVTSEGAADDAGQHAETSPVATTSTAAPHTAAPPPVDVEEPLTIKTDDTQQDQVVAQVVRTEPPSPGGTHKVVVMLPDGNLMVTQVTPEEYASLELDK